MESQEMSFFQGYLYARLERLGTRSQGPEYYLQQLDGKRLHLVKKAHLWEQDPVLQELLGEMVTIGGMKTESGIDVVEVSLTGQPERKPLVDLLLELEGDMLWVHHPDTPSRVVFPPVLRHMALTLSLQWPYRSVWHGECPNSQIFDFWIEDSMGRELWQWSEGMWFRQQPVKVDVPGGSPLFAKVEWPFFDHAIPEEGRYLVRARFLPTGQEVTKTFEVKFVEAGVEV